MKKGTSKALNSAQRAELRKLAILKEDEIDTSDIPEAKDWSGAERGLLFRPVKKQLTLRIDADVIDWFKKRSPNGQGYQTKMNHALREYVQQRKAKLA